MAVRMLGSSRTINGWRARMGVNAMRRRALTFSVATVFPDSAKAAEEANSSPKSPNFSARMVLCCRINARQERRVLEGCGPSHSMDPLAVWAGDTAVRLLQLMYP